MEKENSEKQHRKRMIKRDMRAVIESLRGVKSRIKYQEDDDYIHDLIERERSDKFHFIRFMLFPEIHEPCRPPTTLPYNTHIFKRQFIEYLTAEDGSLTIAWQPFYIPSESYLMWWTKTDETIPLENGPTINQKVPEATIQMTGPTGKGLEKNNIRGIAAYLHITYVGKDEDISGRIESGVYPASKGGADCLYRPVETVRSSYHRCEHTLKEGARSVWVPLTDSDLKFGQGDTSKGLSFLTYFHLTGVPSAPGAFKIEVVYYYDAWMTVEATDMYLPSPRRRHIVGTAETLRIAEHAVKGGAQLGNSHKDEIEKKSGSLGDWIKKGMKELGGFALNEIIKPAAHQLVPMMLASL